MGSCFISKGKEKMNKRLIIAFIVMFAMGIAWGNIKKSTEQSNGGPTVKNGSIEMLEE